MMRSLVRQCRCAGHISTPIGADYILEIIERRIVLPFEDWRSENSAQKLVRISAVTFLLSVETWLNSPVVIALL
jgi:hypothetical protein